MTVSWGAKDPDEVRHYSFSWIGRLNGAEIDSAALELKRGAVVLSSVSNTATGISCIISGGKPCERAELVSRIVTTAGDTLEETILLSIEPSGWSQIGPSTATKRQIVEMAYEECSLAGYEFNVTPEELFSGLRKLDALMAEWRATDKDLNYNAPETFGGGDLEDMSGVPDATISGVAISLAMAIAPAMGKAMGQETRQRLASGMMAIRSICARARESGWARSTVAGSGNRYWTHYSPFMPVGRRRH